MLRSSGTERRPVANLSGDSESGTYADVGEPVVRKLPAIRDRCSDRRTNGALLLALLAVLLVLRVRLITEPLIVVTMESTLTLLLVSFVWWQQRRESPNGVVVGPSVRAGRNWSEILSIAGITLVAISPFAANFLERQMGYGCPPELMLLLWLGWVATLLPIKPGGKRATGISVVASGFLVLLTVFVSDRATEIWLGMFWVVLCLSWLVANHWERVETARATQVVGNVRLRLATVGAGLLLLAIGSWAFGGVLLRPILLELNLMPVSGGETTSDKTATRGGGDGDLIQAAKNHASSVGAVDSDTFIESDQTSLFDVANDTFGKPFIRKKMNKSIALEADRLLHMHEKPAETRGSSQSFAVERHPGEKSVVPQDVKSDELMKWIGPRGINLVTSRYTEFDGTEWIARESGQGNSVRKPEPIDVEGTTWFAMDEQAGRLVSGSGYFSAGGRHNSALKFLRLRTDRIPHPPGLDLWSLEDVSRSDMFSINDDRTIQMTGQEHVPDYIVIRMIHGIPDADDAEYQIANSRHSHPVAGKPDDPAFGELMSMVEKWTEGSGDGWELVARTISGLHREFTLDRSAGSDGSSMSDQPLPLSMFLNRRSGSDLHFATAAALVLRELGFNTRFVTGFHVPRSRGLFFARETSLYREDFHAWIEVCTTSGTWIPLEVTPGYAQAWYFSPWRRFLALLPSLGYGMGGAAVFFVVGWFARSPIFEFLVWCFSPVFHGFPLRLRLKWLLRVLDLRGWLIGDERPPHVLPETFYLNRLASRNQLTAREVKRFFASANEVFFGSSDCERQSELAKMATDLYRKGKWKKLPMVKGRGAGPAARFVNAGQR